MPKGGQIIVDAANVRLTPDGEMVGSGLAAGELIRLSIQDMGQAMPQDCVDRAPIPFQSRMEGQRLGLGLTTAPAFAIESGGWLDVGGGAESSAAIHLPLPKVVRAKASENSSLMAGSGLGAISAKPAIKPFHVPSRCWSCRGSSSPADAGDSA